MGNKNTRYKRMEAAITAALCLDTIIFVVFLCFAGIGQVTLKIIAALLCGIISVSVLYYLFISRELLRKRSLWMTLSAVCILLCMFVSLILNFPSPRFTLL